MRLYGLKSCDTSRAAYRALRRAGHEVSFVDVRETRLSESELSAFYKVLAGDLLNRRSSTWRSLSEVERAAEGPALLRDHPTLMKRPVIEHQGSLYVGWGPDIRAVFLGT